ncbi:Glycoside hydrolase, family 28 [Corchorus olitorius]|uniref:Glycoside hydrolase, family 28 n=1 Tax=Corchorus olitorius TaxID=93759 RepID=A0A1R3K8W3_9ROSI|nr:Glycoside hydrolase, family 28 [Corchorus olitorius]
MAMKLKMIALCLLLVIFASHAKAQPQTSVFDVMNFGAKADGKSNLNQPLLAAWKQACALASPSKIVVAEGEYMLSQVTLEGPCKAPLEVQVKGNLKAPIDPSQYNNIPSWVTFQRIDHLTLSGPGTFDGQGEIAWSQNDCKQNDGCNKLPIAPSRVKISNVSFKNIRGTSATQLAVKLACSSGIPCENVEIGDIDLSYIGTQGLQATSECSNVKPTFSGKQNPSTCGIMD